jgi:transglutaminase-like putative cysteine protease
VSTLYRVTHRTSYRYEHVVRASYGQLHMLPRELAGQRLRRSEVVIDPQPEMYRERLDFFANRTSYFAINEPHQELTVSAISLVDVEDRSQELSLFGERPWEMVRDAVASGDPSIDPDVIQFALDSPLAAGHQLYRDYAQPLFPPGASAIDGIAALSAKIFEDFTYAPGSTSVSTPLAEAFARRTGVCQDFAHVAIACLRALGLPARYVSGYLETQPAPGMPKLTGVDGSHAWLSVFLPDAGWVAVDPTNNQFANGRYVVTAIGRDYSDVPPMNGIIYTDGRTEMLDVAVDVIAVDQDDQLAA